jgi:hypothetical protein
MIVGGSGSLFGKNFVPIGNEFAHEQIFLKQCGKKNAREKRNIRGDGDSDSMMHRHLNRTFVFHNNLREVLLNRQLVIICQHVHFHHGG